MSVTIQRREEQQATDLVAIFFFSSLLPPYFRSFALCFLPVLLLTYHPPSITV